MPLLVFPMCGRYALYGPQSRQRLREIEEEYFHWLLDLPLRFNIAPDQGSPTRHAASVPLIRTGPDGLGMHMAQWWLLPYWSKTRYVTYSTFNAKAETVATAAAFRDPFRQRRCLIPA